MISQTKLVERNKDNIFIVILLGILMGTVFGIIFGILSGIVIGTVFGIIFGILSGIVIGTVFGTTVILINFSEALPFINGIYPVLILIGVIIALTEIVFWLMPKEKVDKHKLFWHTAKRKAECLVEVILGISVIAQIYILIRGVIKYITKEVLQEILKWIGYIGAGVIILGVIVGMFYLWIKLNERKYKK